MNDDKGEGVAIANLIGTDGYSIVGWVYRWGTGAHSVMWSQGPRRVVRCQPDIDDHQKEQIDFSALTEI